MVVCPNTQRISGSHQQLCVGYKVSMKVVPFWIYETLLNTIALVATKWQWLPANVKRIFASSFYHRDGCDCCSTYDNCEHFTA